MTVRVYADGKLIYDPNLDGYELLGLKATVSAEKAGTAEIVMPAGHPAYNSFISYRSIVEIYKNDELLFRGRALYPTDNFYNTRTITCEGERCFLRDATIGPYLYQTAPTVIFADVIRLYNEQVDEFKRFRLGAVTAKDPNDYQYISCDDASQISDVIDKLLDYVGGYIVFTTAPDGQRVINWYGTLDEVNEQVIEFGENLLDFSRTGANTDLATVIWPYGAKDETTGERVTIAAVNNGVCYLKDDEAVALRGVIARPVFWDDVTLASNLLRKAKQYLEVSKLVVTTLSLSVVDLASAGYDVGALHVGRNVRVRSAPHGLNDLFLVCTRTYNLLDESQDTVSLGADTATLTGASVAASRNTLTQLRRSEQSIKTDYKISIADAVNRLANK